METKSPVSVMDKNGNSCSYIIKIVKMLATPLSSLRNAAWIINLPL